MSAWSAAIRFAVVARAGTASPPSKSVSAGMMLWRIATRRYAGSEFIGSCQTSSPSSSHAPTVSARRMCRNGLTIFPLRCAMPDGLPRNAPSSRVSAWSSAVCATQTSRPDSSSAAYLASRAAASTLPGPTVTLATVEANPNSRATAAARSATSAEPGCKPWSTTRTETSFCSAAAAATSANESGPPDIPITAGPSKGRTARLHARKCGERRGQNGCIRVPFRKLAAPR